jgi:AcrR family transcriptional regulator
MVRSDPEVPSRQELRAERSTEALLDAAAGLVAEGGLAATTFAAIGERAGYSRGLVTARFGSKTGLVDALIRRVWNGLRAAGIVPLRRRATGLESLIGLVEGIHGQAVENERDMRAMNALIFEALGADDGLRVRMAAFGEAMRTEVADALRRGIDDGSVRSIVDPGRDAAVVTSALLGIAYQWLLEADGFDVDAAYGALGDLVRTAFTAEP